MKLYRNDSRPGQWVAYVPGTGWVAFPASEHGWEQRMPARGLDPVRLREVPIRLAAKTGILEAENAGELVGAR